MDFIKKLLAWLKPFPFWVRCLLLVLISAVVALMSLFAVSACGTPKTVATVQNVNPNSTVSVTMTVSNTNSSTPIVEIAPSLNPDDLLK